MNFKDYIRGQRHGKDANQLERNAMNDPFLQDAIDGFDSVSGDHLSAVEKLEKQLSTPSKHIDKRVWIWTAAAIFVLLIGIPLFLNQPKIDTNEAQVATSETPQSEEADILLPEKDTVLMAENIEKKVVTTPKVAVQKEKPVVKEVENIQPESEDSDVQAAETTNKPELNFSVNEQLQGRVAGVAVSSQEEKKQSNIRIRGASTIPKLNEKVVFGRLVDTTGEPIIGGTVNIKDTKLGTVTDIDGKFHLVVPENEKGTLVASYVGMKSTEMPLKENVGNIIMQDDTELLSEVVVVGYGTHRKSSKVGSVSKVKEITPTFAENEFTKYFKDNYNKNICADKNIAFSVEFYIDSLGRPGSIDVKTNNCPDLELEIKRLLSGSPLWSERNRKVTLLITL